MGVRESVTQKLLPPPPSPIVVNTLRTVPRHSKLLAQNLVLSAVQYFLHKTSKSEAQVNCTLLLHEKTMRRKNHEVAAFDLICTR